MNRARRIREEDRGEDLPYVEAAAGWLLANLPTLDRVSVLHRDFRTGNILFDEDDGKVTAWLDWERTYLGDRHRDLAWITLPQWGRPTTTAGSSCPASSRSTTSSWSRRSGRRIACPTWLGLFRWLRDGEVGFGCAQEVRSFREETRRRGRQWTDKPAYITT